MLASYKKSLHAAFTVLFVLTLSLLTLSINAHAQSGSSTSISGTVVDSSGAVVANATVEIHNPVSAFERSTTTDSCREFQFPQRSV